MPHCAIHSDVEVPAEALQTHHKHPTAYGGPDIPSNLITLCSTCHDLCHRVAQKLYGGKTGAAQSIVTDYLPEQPQRQKRLLELANIIAKARYEHARNPEMDLDAEEGSFTRVTLRVRDALHHQYKGLAAGVGLERYILQVLEHHAMVARTRPGATIEELYDPEARPAAPTPSYHLLDLHSK